jgi:hypothetical protein
MIFRQSALEISGKRIPRLFTPEADDGGGDLGRLIQDGRGNFERQGTVGRS